MHGLRAIARTRGAMLVALVASAGCADKIPPSPSARIIFEDQPATVDLSLFAERQFQVDGVDALAGVPEVSLGSEAHVTGRLKPIPDALGSTEWFMLKVAYREVIDGKADWSLDDRDLNALQQQPVGLERDGTIDGRIRINENAGFRPGEYEIRFYAIRQDYVDDTKLPIVYHVGKGGLKVLPAADAPTNEAASAGAVH